VNIGQHKGPSAGITEAALEQLAQHCPHLAHVDLSSCASAATNRAVNILLGGPPLDHDSHSDVVMYPEAGGLRATLRHISLRACPNVCFLSSIFDARARGNS
jgi:hypothetical protein